MDSKLASDQREKLPVNKLAGIFGGGGHTNAAGARFRDVRNDSMIPKILKEAENFFNNYSEG